MKTFVSHTSQNPLLVFIIVGLILMLGIILAGENLNAILSVDKPVMASVSPTPTANSASATVPTSASAPTSSPTSGNIYNAIDSLNAVQSLLADPQNLRIVPKDIKPAQAVIEGKTVKFLMGF